MDRATVALAHPFGLFSFLLLGHLVANTVGVPECPNRQLMEDTDLGKDIEIQESVWFFIVSEGIGALRCLRVVLTSGVLVEIIEPASTAKSAHLLPMASTENRYTHVSPRCDDIHLRRHSPISKSFCEGSGVRHSASRSCSREKKPVSTVATRRKRADRVLVNATKRTALKSSYSCE